MVMSHVRYQTSLPCSEAPSKVDNPSQSAEPTTNREVPSIPGEGRTSNYSLTQQRSWVSMIAESEACNPICFE